MKTQKKEVTKNKNGQPRKERVKLKPEKFTFRHTKEVGEMMRAKAEKRKMNVSDYLQYLIKKDRFRDNPKK